MTEKRAVSAFGLMPFEAMTRNVNLPTLVVLPDNTPLLFKLSPGGSSPLKLKACH